MVLLYQNVLRITSIFSCLSSNNLTHFVESLKHVKILQICSGDDHVVALSSDGNVFTWGSSKNGQLGQGHTQCRCKPLAIKLLNMTKIKNIYCGENETVLLTHIGQALVSGNNNYNKLGVPEQDKIMLFTPVLHLKDKIKFVTVGTNHTLMLTETGTLLALGRYTEGQLGKSNFYNYSGPQGVKLKNKITMVACGTNFSIAGDNHNVLWFWGASLKTFNTAYLRNSEKCLVSSNSVMPLFKSAPDGTIIIKDFGIEDSTEEFRSECVKTPQPILAFYSSVCNIKLGNIIHLGDIKINGSNLYILAHTTSSPPVKQFSSNEIHNRNTLSQMEDTTIAPSTLNNLPNVM